MVPGVVQAEANATLGGDPAVALIFNRELVMGFTESGNLIVN
jgi:hypothetical protein